MKIQKLDRSYIDQILELEASSAPKIPIYFKYDKEGLDMLFDHLDTSGVFGAFDGDKLIGWASYRSGFGLEKSEPGEYAMSSMVVHSDYRRQGIGTKLFHARLSEIKQKPDVRKVIATAYPKNRAIIILFLQNGFYISDFKKDLYGPGADRIYLELIP